MHIFIAIFALFFAATPNVPAHYKIVVTSTPSAEDCNAGAAGVANLLAQREGAQSADWVCATLDNPAEKPV